MTAGRPTREQVYGALFARLSGLTGFLTWSRRMILPNDVKPGICPTLRLWEHPERFERDARGLPVRRYFHVDAVIYFLNDDKELSGATVLNPLVDAVEDALRPDGSLGDSVQYGVNTLGGLVEWCRIWGDQIVKETGDTDTRGLGGAVIPIAMLLGPS